MIFFIRRLEYIRVMRRGGGYLLGEEMENSMFDFWF